MFKRRQPACLKGEQLYSVSSALYTIIALRGPCPSAHSSKHLRTPSSVCCTYTRVQETHVPVPDNPAVRTELAIATMRYGAFLIEYYCMYVMSATSRLKIENNDEHDAYSPTRLAYHVRILTSILHSGLLASCSLRLDTSSLGKPSFSNTCKLDKASVHVLTGVRLLWTRKQNMSKLCPPTQTNWAKTPLSVRMAGNVWVPPLHH